MEIVKQTVGQMVELWAEGETVISGTPDWQLDTTTDAEKTRVEAVGTKYCVRVYCEAETREQADFVSEMVVHMIGKPKKLK